VMLKDLPENSTVLAMAQRLADMPTNQTRLPVLGSIIEAYFVDGDTGLQQTDDADWTNKYVDAEEVAVIVPIPKKVLADTGFDMIGMLTPRIIAAIGKTIDRAVYYGTGIPASWTTNIGAAGLVARCTAAGHTISLAEYTDEYEAILGEKANGDDGLSMLLEADGFFATGYVGHLTMKGKLRNTRDANGQPIFHNGNQVNDTFVTGELDGMPILYPRNGGVVAASSLLIAGDWSRLVYSIRQDVDVNILKEATLTDAAGNVTFNLAQRGMIALQVTMRLGVSLPNQINMVNEDDTTRCEFATLTA